MYFTSVFGTVSVGTQDHASLNHIANAVFGIDNRPPSVSASATKGPK